MVIAASVVLVLIYFLARRRPVRLVSDSSRLGTREWQAFAFLSGASLLIVLALPAVRSMEPRSFWVDTAEQLVVMMVVAPLLVLGSPAASWLRLLPSWIRSIRLPRWITGAAAAFALCNGTFALMHLPDLYQPLVKNSMVHDAGQLVLLGLSFFFWAQVIPQGRVKPRLSMVGRAAYLFAASAQTRILGLVFAMAPNAVYAHFVHALGAGGALVDQQIAAGVLIVPGILTDTIALTVCLFLWLGEEERKARNVRDPQPGQRMALGAR